MEAKPCCSRGMALSVIILTLALLAPAAIHADWKIFYTGRAQEMFGAQGRGSFPTRAAAEEYRLSSPGFERDNSYSAGFDAQRPNTRPRNEPIRRPPKWDRLPDSDGNVTPVPSKVAPDPDVAFTHDKAELLDALRHRARKGLGLKGGGSGELQLKTIHVPAVTVRSATEPAISRETKAIEANPRAWIEDERQQIRRRLAKPNPWSRALAASLSSKAPPLPYKKFGELEPGDVLLVEGDANTWHKGLPSSLSSGADGMLSGVTSARASHTLIFLKESKGTKLFLDNQPGEGPRIVPEAYVRSRYGSRQTEIARLAQPLKPDEAAELYKAAKKMRARNVRKMDANHRLYVATHGLAGDAPDKTNYGLWGKENLVCSEASWALINAAGRNVSRTTSRTKRLLGIDFGPADFYANEQHFLITPMAWGPR